MKSYSEEFVFTRREQKIWRAALQMVGSLHFDEEQERLIRCHELARAVGQLLELPVIDGRFGMFEHSWLWTRTLTIEESTQWGQGGWLHEDRPRILDVYRPGAMPMVVMLDTWCLLSHRERFVIEEPRTDIDDRMVDRLVSQLSLIDWKAKLR